MPPPTEIQTSAKLSLKQQILKREFSRLEDKRTGKLIAQNVVDSARPPDSPLHSFFEWDDRIAGEAYRLDQARNLIREYKVDVLIEQMKYKVHYYVHVHNANGEQGYRALLDVEDDAEKRKIITSEMQTALAHLRRAGSIAKAIDNTKLHEALTREVAQIERYLDTLVEPPKKPPARSGTAGEARKRLASAVRS